MSETGTESLDDLVLGNDSEAVGESDEQFRARMASAQAKLAKLAKDEKKTKDFDLKLAKIIRHVSNHTLRLVVFLIDHDVPSLTILAIISLINDEAGKICYHEFHQNIKERPDFSLLKLDAKIEDRISWWWSFIFEADKSSVTTKLMQFRNNESFTELISFEFAEMLRRFLNANKIDDFNEETLRNMLDKYERFMYGTK